MDYINSPKINIRSLYEVQNNKVSVKEQTFNEILENCHNKIKNINKKHKTFCCTYLPPITIHDRPMYNYKELVYYIIIKLRNDGFKVVWDNINRNIFISWHPNDVSIPPETEYQGQEDTKSIVLPNLLSNNNNLKFVKIKNNDKIQHMAFVNHGNDVTELLPISINNYNNNNK